MCLPKLQGSVAWRFDIQGRHPLPVSALLNIFLTLSPLFIICKCSLKSAELIGLPDHFGVPVRMSGKIWDELKKHKEHKYVSPLLHLNYLLIIDWF